MSSPPPADAAPGRSAARPRRRRPRGVHVALAVGLAVVAVGSVTGVRLARDLQSIRTHVADARGTAEALQSRLQAAELEDAQRLAEQLRDTTADLREDTRGWDWSLAAAVPVAGNAVRVAQDLGDLAAAAGELAVVAVDRAGPLLAGEVDLLAGPQQIDLGVFDVLAEELAQVDESAVATAADRTRNRDGWIPGELAAGRDEALATVDRMLAALSRARDAVAVLPGFFGAEGPRTYFLGLQNPAELRGTGGLLGEFTVMTIEDGTIEIERIEHYGELELAREREQRYAEVPASPEFAERYDHVLGRGFLSSVNLDPDLPTVGPVLTAIGEDRLGRALDGVILLDPIGLERLLDGKPPIALPADAAERAGLPPQVLAAALSDLPDPLPVVQFADVALIGAYDVLGGASPARRAYIEALGAAAFDAALSGADEVGGLLRALADVAASRHLQVYATRSTEQALFEHLGVAGSMPAAATAPSTAGPVDVLAVTAANSGGDKKDVHVRHRLSAAIRLSVDGAAPDSADAGPVRRGSRDLVVGVDAVNPLGASGHDPYILGGLAPETVFSTTQAPYEAVAPLRTWFSVWVPEGTEASTMQTRSGEPIMFTAGSIHHHRVFDHVLEVPPESEDGFEVRASGPVVYRVDDDELVYELLLWHQAKGIPDEWDITVTPPDGYRLDAVDVGGGFGGEVAALLGPVVGGPPLRALVRAAGTDGSADPGEVRLSGLVTRDVTLTVRLAPN